MNINLKIWRQGSGTTKGGLRAYRLENIERFYHRDINTEPYWYDVKISGYHYYHPIIFQKMYLL